MTKGICCICYVKPQIDDHCPQWIYKQKFPIDMASTFDELAEHGMTKRFKGGWIWFCNRDKCRAFYVSSVPTLRDIHWTPLGRQWY